MNIGFLVILLRIGLAPSKKYFRPPKRSWVTAKNIDSSMAIQVKEPTAPSLIAKWDFLKDGTRNKTKQRKNK